MSCAVIIRTRRGPRAWLANLLARIDAGWQLYWLEADRRHLRDDMRAARRVVDAYPALLAEKERQIQAATDALARLR
jgi:hypothetical protein